MLPAPLQRFSDRSRPPTGHILLKVYRHGILDDVWETKNLIVNGSKQVHAQLLGGNFTNNDVTQFAVGTNGTAPAAGNTAPLTGQYANALAAPTFPASNQVQFNFSLGTTEANGMAIEEFGLLTAGGALYARQVRSTALNKDNTISFTGAWTISF